MSNRFRNLKLGGTFKVNNRLAPLPPGGTSDETLKSQNSPKVC